MSVFTSENKRMSLAEAACIVQDGMTIAIGAARTRAPGTT